MSVNGKRDHFTKEELIYTGKSISISRPEEIMNEVITAVDKWMEFANKAGVKKSTSQDIKKQNRIKL